jgi:hypothetical protein
MITGPSPKIYEVRDILPHVSGISWYLRSLADADTYRGSYSTVTRSVHGK